MARDDLKPLNMASPPWWDHYQAWATEQDPDADRFIEGDPRARVMIDGLAYEVAVEAFGAGYAALLTELIQPSRLTMSQRVMYLRAELVRYEERMKDARANRPAQG